MVAHISQLDILILYNGGNATSASAHPTPTLPFPPTSLNAPCNSAYAYFLKYCQSLGLRAGLSTSNDITGPGLCSSYWVYRNSHWTPVSRSCHSNVVFDKFNPLVAPGLALRELFFSLPLPRPYNSPTTTTAFFDKYQTHLQLGPGTIPTSLVPDPTLRSIRRALRAISLARTRLANSRDFNSSYILKDRYGAGGWHVYKIAATKHAAHKIQTILKRHPKTFFILQPFAVFDRGFTHNSLTVPTDIRLIYLNGTLFQSYLRFPKAGDFRCNEHQGGSSRYITVAEIPPEIRVQADRLAHTLQANSLFSLDFVMTNTGNAYLIEGNTGPGLSWNKNNQTEVTRGKKLIRGIIDQLALSITPPLSRDIPLSSVPSLYSSTPTPILRSVTNTVSI